MELIDALQISKAIIDWIRPRRILIAVEDNATDADFLREQLEALNIKSDIAKSAEEAIGLMKKTRYYYALIDIGLPQMDGTTLAEKIRDKYPEMIIIFVTGFDKLDLPIGELVCAIRKPVTTEALKKVMKM